MKFWTWLFDSGPRPHKERQRRVFTFAENDTHAYKSDEPFSIYEGLAKLESSGVPKANDDWDCVGGEGLFEDKGK